MAATAFNNPFEHSAWNWTFNATHLPSAKDLALAGPRALLKLGSLFVPETVDNILGARLANRIIPDATGSGGRIVEAITTTATTVGRDAAYAATNMVLEVEEEVSPGAFGSRFSLEGARSLGSVFSYMTSKWAMGCILMAVVLNRTSIYASTRRRLDLGFKGRLVLRGLPILLLVWQCRSLLQSIQCQTSPDFGLLRWGNATKTSELLHTIDGGILHTFSKGISLGQSDEKACLAIGMIPYYDEALDRMTPGVELTGSLSRLWPLFQTFSMSQFVETLSCAVQGRMVAAETGMTLFEHSLAFAEADAAVGTRLGFGPFGSSKTVKAWSNSTWTADATEIALTRSMLLKRLNTTPEVLLVGFLSAANHLTSHVLAIFNLQGRFRLLNTGFWGLSFMAAIVWSVGTFDLDDIGNQSLLRFPTVCVVGFIPHVLVLGGILLCAIIYAAALILSAIDPPDNYEALILDEEADATPPRFPVLRRLKVAHYNMQANIPLSNIRITMHMDFYTALLKTGFSVMTMASEAVYLNESRGVSIRQRTWLEEDRLKEIETVGAQWLGPSFRNNDPNSGLGDSMGLVAATDQPMNLLHKSTSGYAREMTAKKGNAKKSHDRVVRDGVGATERSGRWIMALEFFVGIARLLLGWWATLALRGMGGLGIRWRPGWLLWLLRRPRKGEKKAQEDNKENSEDPNALKFWMLSNDGELTLPTDENVDVEKEIRNRLRHSIEVDAWDSLEEEKLDDNLYDWWKSGGWWGAEDGSGDFELDRKEFEEDNTSEMSFATIPSTTADYNPWETEDEDTDSGRRTPTQRSPQGLREASPIVDNPLSRYELAQLLNPKTPEQRNEAQTLAAHLSSDVVLTRSRYMNAIQRERTRVLTSTRERPRGFKSKNIDGKLSDEEEAQILEYLIVTSRSLKDHTSSSTSTSSSIGGKEGNWVNNPPAPPTSISPSASASSNTHKSGTSDSQINNSSDKESGPQCVVCQSSPRSIIVWPCRCLALCDDCRVSLAMNNFDKCVCCRRDVGSFSRIWVP